jgi:hypothetical protein
MKVVDYLDKHNILWQPVQIIWENGKKRTVGFGNSFIPKTNDPKKLTREEIISRRNKVPEFTHIAIHTNEVNQFDIDVPGYEQEQLKNAPYFKSVSKRLKHYFVKVEGAKQESYEVRGGDLLTGKWSFCRYDEIMINENNDIPALKLSEFQQREKSKLYEIITDLSNITFDYNEWISLCMAILNSATEDCISREDANDLMIKFSEKDPKFDDNAINKITELKYDPKGLKMASIVMMHKEQAEQKQEL